MAELKAVMQQVAPTLSSALEGPFSGIATGFIRDRLVVEGGSENRKPAEIIDGVLTAGVGQILCYWFTGASSRKTAGDG